MQFQMYTWESQRPQMRGSETEREGEVRGTFRGKDEVQLPRVRGDLRDKKKGRSQSYR